VQEERIESQLLVLRAQREDLGLFLLESGKCLVQNAFAKPNQIFEIVRGESFCEAQLTKGVVSVQGGNIQLKSFF